jgi:hypothetical protein
MSLCLLVSRVAALLDNIGEGQRWKDCMADLKKYVTHKVTKPFIQNVQVPGKEDPGLTFSVRAHACADVAMG